MDIIIHGKPEAGRHKATPSLDPAFTDKLVNEYFQASSSYSGNNSLLIEIRQWRNTWYSVYTYWMGKDLKDAGGRPGTFFAITLVIPGKYAQYTSSIQNLLIDTIRQHVIGNYIDQVSGQYIDMDSKDVFDRIVKHIQSNFHTELKPIAGIRNPGSGVTCANPNDCDAQSFINGLMQTGRGKVCPSVPARDEEIHGIQSLKAELHNCRSLCQAKDNELIQLNESLQQARAYSERFQQEANQQIAQLQQRIASLEQQLGSASALAQERDDLKRRLGQIAEIVGSNVAMPVQQYRNRKRGNRKSDIPSEGYSGDGSGWKSMSHPKIIAAAVIALLAIGLLLYTFGGRGNRSPEVIDSLQKEQPEVVVDENHDHGSETSQETDKTAADADKLEATTPEVEYCDFKLKQDGKVLKSGSTFDPFKPLKLVREDGYENCKLLSDNANIVSVGNEILIQPIDSKKPVKLVCTTAKSFDQLDPKQIVTLHFK